MKAVPFPGQIRLIFLSNSDAAGDIEDVYRKNGNCYVVKPPDMAGMYRFVDALKGFWGERVRFSPGLA